MGTVDHPAAERMSRSDLEAEVVALRASRNDGVRTRDLERLTARVARLEQSNRGLAGQLARSQSALRAAEANAAVQKRLRLAAERNATRFHALLLQERVRKIVRAA